MYTGREPGWGSERPSARPRANVFATGNFMGGSAARSRSRRVGVVVKNARAGVKVIARAMCVCNREESW